MYLDKEVRQNFKTSDPYQAWPFMSLSASLGRRMFPIDDILAVGYILYYFLNQGLPKPKDASVHSEISFDQVEAGKKQEFSQVRLTSSFIHSTHCTYKTYTKGKFKLKAIG